VTRHSLTGISFPATATRDGNGDKGDSLMVTALAVSSCSTVQLTRRFGLRKRAATLWANPPVANGIRHINAAPVTLARMRNTVQNDKLP